MVQQLEVAEEQSCCLVYLLSVPVAGGPVVQQLELTEEHICIDENQTDNFHSIACIYNIQLFTDSMAYLLLQPSTYGTAN